MPAVPAVRAVRAVLAALLDEQRARRRQASLVDRAMPRDCEPERRAQQHEPQRRETARQRSACRRRLRPSLAGQHRLAHARARTACASPAHCAQALGAALAAGPRAPPALRAAGRSLLRLPPLRQQAARLQHALRARREAAREQAGRGGQGRAGAESRSSLSSQQAQVGDKRGGV